MSNTPLGPIIHLQREAPGVPEAGRSCSLLQLLPTPGRVDLGEASFRQRRPDAPQTTGKTKAALDPGIDQEGKKKKSLTPTTNFSSLNWDV